MDNPNKKIMFITLGTGQGVSHGILFSIKKQNPDTIVFIASEKSIKTYDEIVNNLSDKPFEIIKEDCPEVNDIEIIYKNFSAIIKKYINKGFTKENIVVDYTSGTKAMSAAIVAVAIANGFSNFSYVSGERDIGGRVLSGTERLNSLTVNRIVTENYLRLFLVFFNKNQFDLALGVLDQINEVHPDFEVRKGWVSNHTLRRKSLRMFIEGSVLKFQNATDPKGIIHNVLSKKDYPEDLLTNIYRSGQALFFPFTGGKNGNN